MAADDLSAPLGQDTSKGGRTLPIAVPQAIAGRAGRCSSLVFAGWAMLVDDPFGGEPMVVVRGRPRAAARRKAEDAGAPPRCARRPAGRPQPLRRPRRPEQPAAPIAARTPRPSPSSTARAASGRKSCCRARPTRTTSRGAHRSALARETRATARCRGSPRTARGRPRSMPARSRRSPASRTARASRIVIGGLGIGAAGTAERSASCRGPVTFAFAPYGGDLERLVGARAAKAMRCCCRCRWSRSTIPTTIRARRRCSPRSTPAQNIDRLHWLMSRFQGYVGHRELHGRPLHRLRAGARAGAARGRQARPDLSRRRLLAAQPREPDRRRQQSAFRQGRCRHRRRCRRRPSRARARRGSRPSARERGVAVGFAGALPVSIERIADGRRRPESRGVLLVPITAVATRPKSS